MVLFRLPGEILIVEFEEEKTQTAENSLKIKK